MSLKQRKRKRFKDKIEPQQIKPYILKIEESPAVYRK